MFLSWSYLGHSWFWRKAVYQRCGGKYKGLCKWNVVMFHTTDPTPSPSLLEMLRRCIVDHHTLPVVHSLCPSRQFLYWPESSGTLLYAKTPLPYLQHFTCQQTLLNTCILTQHLGLQSCTEQIPYVQSPLPHVCFIIPHVTVMNDPPLFLFPLFHPFVSPFPWPLSDLYQYQYAFPFFPDILGPSIWLLLWVIPILSLWLIRTHCMSHPYI